MATSSVRIARLPSDRGRGYRRAVKLYSYWRSSSAYRVRIALALKGVSYEYVAVRLDAEEHRTVRYRQDTNPLGQVPVLELDTGERLVQSLPIVEYLEEQYPNPRLLPNDPVPRARARALAEIINSAVQPLQNRGVLQHVTQLGGSGQAWARHFIARGLRALEAQAAGGSGRYLVGDHVSLADVFLVPQMYNAVRQEIDLSELPTLVRVDAECRQLAAFAGALPERQPDAEPHASGV